MPLFSLKELITQSAKQLKYLRDFPNKKKKPTEAQYEGISFQDKIANSIYGVISQEMGNFIPFNGNRIYFSCDIVGLRPYRRESLVEHIVSMGKPVSEILERQIGIKPCQIAFSACDGTVDILLSDDIERRSVEVDARQ